MYVIMGLSSGDDDLEMKEEVVIQLKDDSRESRNNLMTENVETKGFDLEPEFDFSPIQHPTEPSHEDRPVQCPMPHSSQLISDERMQDDRFSDRRRPEAKTLLHKANIELKAITPPVRMVRKRHHDHTNAIIPLLQMPPVHPHLHQKDGERLVYATIGHPPPSSLIANMREVNHMSQSKSGGASDLHNRFSPPYQ